MKFHISKSSSNAKTGKMPVTTSPQDTCPLTCPWKEHGCYAKYGPLNCHWVKVSKGVRGNTWQEFLKEIQNLPEHAIWRHNQAGDLYPTKDRLEIDGLALLELIAANKGKRGYTYTHYPVFDATGVSHSTANINRNLISIANRGGFTINLSADSLEEADQMVDLGIAPVTTVVDSNERRSSFKSSGGNRVTLCPAIARDDMSCARCKLCAKPNRKTIIAFPAHGSSKKSIDNSLNKS